MASEYPKDYRSNSRLIVFEHKIAAAIWARVLPHLKEADVANVTPVGFATQGTWLPIGVNECLLFSRYQNAQKFKAHNDGMYQSFEGDCSIFTITVYLNDNFEGGKVNFLRGTAEKHSHVHTFTPVRGSALIFNHDTLHEGEAVSMGSKYILRTSIMFRRVSDLSDPQKSWEKNRDWQRMFQLFSSFSDLQNEKDPAKFTARFLEAQTIQLRGGRSIHSPAPPPVPVDILQEIIDNLPVKYIVKFFMVSRSVRQVSRSGQIWKRRLEADLGVSVETLVGPSLLMTKADPALVDWYPLYKRMFQNKSAFDPMVSYFTATTAYTQTLSDQFPLFTSSTITSHGMCALLST